MPVPDSTSAEAFERYVGGKCLVACRGKAWRDIKAWIIAPLREVEVVHLPSVSEPFLAWSVSGEADFEEREENGPWIKHRIKRGSFFLTSGGAPYDCRWKAIGSEPFQSMAVFIALPLLQRAFEDVFVDKASKARLRDISAFEDRVLNSYMEQVHGELMRPKASPLFLQGIGQSIAIYLARNYAEITEESKSGSPALPGFKLRQITDWMAENFTDEFDLDRLAARAGLSKFYFTRLFKTATGISPLHYHMNLRMDAAKRLLRETKKSALEIALEVGYANPSHFAQVFRKATGLSPSDYRQQR